MIIALRILLTFLIVLNVIVDAARIFYEEISETDGNTIPEESMLRTSIIHKSFHQCSIKETCNYIIKNLADGSFALYNNEDDIPRNRTGLRIWRKFYHDTFNDCQDAHDRGRKVNGVFKIKVPSFGSSQVRCDMTTQPGGWIVFQRRVDGTGDFYRDWKDYKDGFGDLNGNFWLGLEKLHQLAGPGARASLRVDLKHISKPNEMKYAEYTLFEISGESDGYKLTIGGYSGNAGDSLAYHNGMKFSTKDKDQDLSPENCATITFSAFWNNACFRATLNNLYPTDVNSGSKDMSWYSMAGKFGGIIFSEMKIRK